jgi:hypothetical protein
MSHPFHGLASRNNHGLVAMHELIAMHELVDMHDLVDMADSHAAPKGNR